MKLCYLNRLYIRFLAFCLIILILYLTYTSGGSKFRFPSLEGCAIIGAPNATINDCGYCVGGESSLPNDYGKDCKGDCFGTAVIDCDGVCGGSAYVDECTGICITAELISKNEVNVSLNRDCRGMCVPPELSRPQQQAYDKDECGYCRLQSSDKSQFIDCNGNCHLPGTTGASLVCGQCVPQNEMLRVLDECGNCRDLKKDSYFCGCNDPNICYKAKSLTPKAIPLNVVSNILVFGYFHPIVRDLYCLIQHKSSRDIIAFPVAFINRNKTAITCTVKLEKEGYYNVVIGFQRNMLSAFNNNEFIKLYAYDLSKVIINDIQPIKLLTTDYYKTVDIKFNVEESSLPQIPFKCIVRYSDNKIESTNESNQPFTCSLPQSKLRAKHQILTVYPTFDGNSTLSHGFELIIEDPLPKISQQNCYISEDGLAIVIKFDNPVSIRNKLNSSLSDCDYMLSTDTITELSHYAIESCLWASTDQLIIYTKQSIVINKINIKFNKNIFKLNEHQLFNDTGLEVLATKLSWSWWRYEPMVAITGPSEIPICGSFALSGHFSSPRGTSDVYFRWDVMGDVSDELKEYVEENGKSTNLLMSAEFFEIHVPYKFIFKVYITERDQTLEAGHTLIRLDYDSPIVSIYHTALLQLTPLHVNQEILFLADYSVPECVFPVQKVNILWKVNDPRILFPLTNSTEHITTRHSWSYKITPFTVPVDQTVGIFLNAYFGFRYNETSGAGFTFSASKAPLVANIANGCHKMTIGSNSGLFTISSGSAKYEQNRSLVFQWSCHDIKTAQPCYYKFDSETKQKTDPLLIDRSLQNQQFIRLNSSALEVNKNYAFGLQVFDANDHTSASQTEYIFVNVIEGNAPQVYVGPVYVKGKHLTSNNPQFNATIVVPARTHVTIKGIVRPAKNIYFKWEAINSVHKLNWKYKYVNDEIHTELYLHENHIIPFGEYVVKLIACDITHLCSEADLSLIAPQGVTNCKLSIDSFTEYELTIANIQECNTPAGYAPLTYQIYLTEENTTNMIPLTVPQYHNVITFAGTSSSSSSAVNARFAAQVCDKFSVCSVYFSQSVQVQRSSDEEVSISELLLLAKRTNTAGDSIAALSVLATIFVKNDLYANNLTEKAINASIDYSTDALIKPSQTLSDGHIAVAYYVLSAALKKTDNTALKRRLLANIINFSRKSVALKVLPKIDTIKTVYSNLMLYFKKAVEQKRFGLFLENIQLMSDIRRSFKEIRRLAAAQIQFGTEITLSSESDTDTDGTKVYNSITKIIHSDKIHNIQISAKLNKDTTVEAIITFGEEVKSLYRNGWDCGQEMLCHSVVYTVTLYPDDNPYMSLEESHQLTPVIDVTIHAPNTGNEQEIKGFLQAATFKITLTGNETYGGPDYHTLCFYYDEVEEIWKKDDVHPLGIAYKNASCLTGHLTAFVVLRIIIGVSANYVIGIVVAVVMGILVFAIMVALFVQRKKDDNAVSPIAQPTPKAMKNVQKLPLNSNRNNQIEHQRRLNASHIEVVT